MSSFEEIGLTNAKLAVENDEKGEIDTAIRLYGEAIYYLTATLEVGSKIGGLEERINSYKKRQERLVEKKRNNEKLNEVKSSLSHALDLDSQGKESEAFELYLKSAELCLKTQKELKDEETLKKVKELALKATERAEEIKMPNKNKTLQNQSRPENRPKLRPLGDMLKDSGEGGTRIRASSISTRRVTSTLNHSDRGEADVYSKEELNVLRQTSFVNGRKYLPFMDDDYKEKFNLPLPFTDSDGYLSLSLKQKSSFKKWVRVSDLSDDPKLIINMGGYNIKQTIVSDCSLVSSLVITAEYERKYKKRLISAILYPQNRGGSPVYNSSGKYMVKLHLNGVLRKIIIDDYLPLSNYNDLLCSFSLNPHEFWVSIVEKAYLKVMGGYDFPGSNSSIDLHALTGWIPERISMTSKGVTFNSEKEFAMLNDRFHKGHCLITVATGEISQAEADRAGLVPTHAYALLDMKVVQDVKLLQLKNPWSHLRWKGNYSELDLRHWTETFKSQLKYDPVSAASKDDGVFWIDYPSLMKYFDVFYVNWDPGLFQFTSCVHQTWFSKDGPKRDSYNMSDNPQFQLFVHNGDTEAAIWLLLTRHITDKDDFAENKEFITLVIYKNNAKRVYYPSDPPPYIDGVRINSPHYLCKIKVPGKDFSGREGIAPNKFTVVISQYEKNNTLNYTIRAYSTCNFSLKKMAQIYDPKLEKSLVGEWKGKSAGGCRNNKATFQNNPIFQVKLDNSHIDNNLLVELKAPKSFNVGFEVVCEANYVPTCYGSFKTKDSGSFRSGYCCLELEEIPGGIYNIQPSTFLPGQEASFFLEFSSTYEFSVKKL